MKREVKIGLFTIVTICCSWAGIRFLSGIDIFGRSVDYYASFDSITGINTASSVLCQGVKVGSVTDIILDPANSKDVTLKLSIKRRYAIPEDSQVAIISPSLMSSMALGLTLGDSPTALEEGGTIGTNCEPGMMEMAADKLMGVADQIAIIGDELTKTLSGVNTLIENNSNNIDSTLGSLSSISEEISALLSQQSSSLNGAIEGISTFAQTLGENSQNIESIISNLDTLSAELTEAQLGGSLSTTLDELNATLQKVNSAEGSAGKLLSDEELYNNLAAVSGSLNTLIVDMQAHPKRYVHFSLFGSKSE